MDLEICGKSKCGEFNMLKCFKIKGHEGECSFSVDRKNDYPWNKKKKDHKIEEGE